MSFHSGDSSVVEEPQTVFMWLAQQIDIACALNTFLPSVCGSICPIKWTC